MSARPLRAHAIALLAFGASLGCGLEHVVVAERVDGGVGAECTNNETCSPDLFCSKASCGAPGTCQLPPAFCDDQREPVCGCDGVNYWNDCLRMRDRVPARTAGQCTDAGTPC